eukprot:TRINITY_DN1247_c0_g1_i2.p2 TRINITY_DN1247_c0_g1~~TRINITY_DN1247_c0_g1_i2.p2  ORF type:complete len:101 (+),score=1.83 TRINITY_DN1247_c0_g1_i2:1676-1978(+)
MACLQVALELLIRHKLYAPLAAPPVASGQPLQRQVVQGQSRQMSAKYSSYIADNPCDDKLYKDIVVVSACQQSTAGSGQILQWQVVQGYGGRQMSAQHTL